MLSSIPPHPQDRSDKADLGTQAFFGNFNTFETLSIFKQQQPENAAGEHAPALCVCPTTARLLVYSSGYKGSACASKHLCLLALDEKADKIVCTSSCDVLTMHCASTLQTLSSVCHADLSPEQLLEAVLAEQRNNVSRAMQLGTPHHAVMNKQHSTA
jgi:hypothetical protein